MYDIELWHVEPDGMVTAAGLTGVPISGIRKLVQRWLIAFLQDPDSKLYKHRRIPYGTYFMPQLRKGMMRSEMDVVGGFALSRAMVRGALESEQRPTDPPDELYKDSTLNKIELMPGQMHLHITIESHVDQMDIVLPIAV